MDRVLFGDNQFFGINHMSEDKALAQARRFKEIGAVIRVLDVAYDLGVRTFMCTTHERIGEICDHVRAHPDRYARFEFCPCMPYAHKYANAMTELGMLGTLRKYAAGSVVGTIMKGGFAAAKRDVVAVMKLLVDAEMKMFAGLHVGAVFLQNIVTDLLFGLGLRDAFAAFAAHIRETYGAEPGFVTMNLPRLVAFLADCGIEDPIVCSSINKIGFRMNPSREACEQALRAGGFRAIAMSVLASGALAPREALEYVCGLEGVDSILFGASTRGHIQQTKELIDALSRTAA
jgi:hypothetical protein